MPRNSLEAETSVAGSKTGSGSGVGAETSLKVGSGVGSETKSFRIHNPGHKVCKRLAGTWQINGINWVQTKRKIQTNYCTFILDVTSYKLLYREKNRTGVEVYTVQYILPFLFSSFLFMFACLGRKEEESMLHLAFYLSEV